LGEVDSLLVFPFIYSMLPYFAIKCYFFIITVTFKLKYFIPSCNPNLGGGKEMEKKSKKSIIFLTLVFSVLTATALISGTVGAKSVYAIANINANPTPIVAYDIQGNLIVYQNTYNVPYYGWGAVGLAIDSDNEILFVTYEMSDTIQLLDAKTFVDLGTTTAPGAVNLAGIVVDHDNGLLYTVDRYTDNLYVYSWNASTYTLTLQPGFPIDLPNAVGLYGIALDEVNDLLYAADGDGNKVQYFDTTSWTEQGSFTVVHNPIGIAIDVSSQFVYTVAGFWSSDYLSKYDLGLATETFQDMGHGGMGVAVDPATSLVYVNGGYSGDDLSVWDTSSTPFVQTDTSGYIGDPTGLCVPGKEVSYNPLNLSKDDGLSGEDCVSPGGYVTYEICFDNELNQYDVHNVTINDTLPVEVDFASATDGGVYDSVNHIVTWNIGTLPAGAPLYCLQLVVKVDPTTPSNITIVNHCTIDSDETPTTTTSEETKICPCSMEVWVDDNWLSQSDVDTYNTSLTWQYDALNNIQDAVNKVCDCGVVHVLDGIYHEQILINKDVFLLGEPNAKIIAPAVLNTYSIEGSGSWAPIIFAYGGTLTGNDVSGSDNIGVMINGFEIDGNFKNNSVGILYHNVESVCAPSVISNNTIKNLDIGIKIDGCTQDTTIIHNHIEWPDHTIDKIGVVVTESGGCEPADVHIHYNYIGVPCGNNIGVWNQVTDMVDATLNWWSIPDGPRSPSSGDNYDPITGRIADGFGEKVVGLVHFDPWAGIDAIMTISQTSAMVGEPIFFNSADSYACHMDGTYYDFYEVKWKFDDGYYSFDDSTAHIYNNPGVYHANLRVKAIDMDLWPNFMLDWSRTTITISADGMDLVANADGEDLGGHEGAPNEVIRFYSYAIGGAPPYTYTWDFDDGTAPAYGQNPTHIYDDDDIYTVTLTVTDSNGETTTDTVQATVSSGTLIAYEGGPYSGMTNVDIYFSGYATGGTEPYNYEWDFGDGTASQNGQTTIHIYEIPGVYTATLIVTDNNGNTDYATSEVILNTDRPEEYREITSLNQGWSFISLPYDQTIDKTTLFIEYNGFYYNWDQAITDINPLGTPLINQFIFGWDRTVQSYAFNDLFEPGHGYWLYAGGDCKIWVQEFTMPDDNYITDIATGWNIIGVLGDQIMSKTDDLMVTYDGNDYTWPDAVNNNIVNDYIFGWNRIGQSYTFSDIFEPGYSYWVYAYQPCTLKRTGT